MNQFFLLDFVCLRLICVKVAKVPRKTPINNSRVSATARGKETEKRIKSISTGWKLRKEKIKAMTKIIAKEKNANIFIDVQMLVNIKEALNQGFYFFVGTHQPYHAIPCQV